MSWDVVIIGAGPAGLFAARTLSEKLRVVVLERKHRTGGAGGITDGKLNLSHRVGLDLAELQMSAEEAEERIAAVDAVFLAHGADPKLHGADEERVRGWLERVSWVRHRTAAGGWDVTLVPVPQRHMGSDFAPQVVARLTEDIARRGVEFSLETEVQGVCHEPDGTLHRAHLEGGVPGRRLSSSRPDGMERTGFARWRGRSAWRRVRDRSTSAAGWRSAPPSTTRSRR